MELKGHFNGQHVILDEPVPASIPALTPVTVMFQQNGTESKGTEGHDRHEALRLVAEWYATSNDKDEVYWKGLVDEIAMGRFALRSTEDFRS